MSTIVSVLPFAVVVPTPGAIPPHHEIPPGSHDDIGICHVKDAFYTIFKPHTEGMNDKMKIPIPDLELAESLINDYTNSCLGVDRSILANGASAIPGLFLLPGQLSKAAIIKDHSDKIKLAKANTIAWFGRLVMMADDDWNKTRQFRSITGLQREACTYLALHRDWNFSAQESVNNRCWACKQEIHPEAIICSGCNAILDQAKFDANKGRFTKVGV